MFRARKNTAIKRFISTTLIASGLLVIILIVAVFVYMSGKRVSDTINDSLDSADRVSAALTESIASMDKPGLSGLLNTRRKGYDAVLVGRDLSVIDAFDSGLAGTSMYAAGFRDADLEKIRAAIGELG